MREYTENDVLRLAKRFHNTKRTYLLVNPLQGKHLAVRPMAAFEMLHSLGEKVKNKFPRTRLVIGFAETATAVGMAVAEDIHSECMYIQTTREEIPGEGRWVDFLEEHSHATEQRLAGTHLEEWLKHTNSVVFVDDEISTGKTLLNFVRQLKKEFPVIKDKTLVAASIINRLSEENEAMLEAEGMVSVSLLHIPSQDYGELVKNYRIREAAFPQKGENGIEIRRFDASEKPGNPRAGIPAGIYSENCMRFSDAVMKFCHDVKLESENRILVLGTEECMYPAMVLARRMEESYGCKAYTHSTTRSPIGISSDLSYPITGGYKLHSLYDRERMTYIYNLHRYDLVFVVTDSNTMTDSAVEDILTALWDSGNRRVILVRG